MSLSDTDSRPRATIADCGGRSISSSVHSGERARASPEGGGGGLLSKSDLSRTGGGGGTPPSGGGKESPPSSVYPAPQPLHRIRSSGDDGMGLSQDPNFFPPIPLSEDGGSEKPSSRGEMGKRGGGGAARRLGTPWMTLLFFHEPSMEGFTSIMWKLLRFYPPCFLSFVADVFLSSSSSVHFLSALPVVGTSEHRTSTSAPTGVRSVFSKIDCSISQPRGCQCLAPPAEQR